jgi:hypothetical protein
MKKRELEGEKRVFKRNGQRIGVTLKCSENRVAHGYQNFRIVSAIFAT